MNSGFCQRLRHLIHRLCGSARASLEPFWLKAILAQGQTCLCLCEAGVFIVRPCKLVSMPRKGWTVMEVPNGWYEVLRGPRPPSVRWPVVSRGQPSQRCQSAAPPISPAVKESSGTSDHTQDRPGSASFSNEEFARRCDRCSTRQSHRARDQCPRVWQMGQR